MLTIYFIRAVNDCVCCMSISDEVHAIFLTVQGSLWSDKKMDRERKPSKSSIIKIWDLHFLKSTWMIWQRWGFLVISNNGKNQNFLQEGRNKWNQSSATAFHQMQRFESGSKSEGSIQSLLQCSKVSFDKKYIYLGTKARTHKVILFTKSDIKPVRPELYLS